MAKKIQFRISADGTVRAETIGIKGPGCESFLKLFERLTDARITDSAFTKEYYEEVVAAQDAQSQARNEGNNHGT